MSLIDSYHMHHTNQLFNATEASGTATGTITCTSKKLRYTGWEGVILCYSLIHYKEHTLMKSEKQQ